MLEQIALFATLWWYARRGPRFAHESAAGPIGTGMLLGMLGLGIVWLVELPFTLLDVWWARRHDLTESGYLEWAFEHWFELGAEFVAICFALLVVMALARWLGEMWWIPGAAVFLSVGAFFAFVQPYLVPTEPLRDPGLRQAAREFEHKQGVGKIPISIEDVSDTTSQANAYAVGFGPSRKVVLWSTMVDGSFSDPEIRVVLAQRSDTTRAGTSRRRSHGSGSSRCPRRTSSCGRRGAAAGWEKRLRCRWRSSSSRSSSSRSHRRRR